MTPAENLVCAIVRGDVTSWPLSDDVHSVDQLMEAAFKHGLHLILLDSIKKSSARCWPPPLLETMENEAAKASSLDLIGERELRGVLTSLDKYGVKFLLLKGVPLAYTLYNSPTLRLRGDTDLLVRTSDLESVAYILRKLGYSGADPQPDKLTSYECLFTRKDSLGKNHYLDVHWKINNSHLFANIFTFDELYAEAIQLPALAPGALGLSYIHALTLACIHRFAHAHAPFYVNGKAVYAGDNLTWVYDIHLLSSALTTSQWSKFTALAKRKGMAQFCTDGLNAANEAFNTQIPAEVMVALQTAEHETKRNLQRLRTSWAAWFFANLRALPKLDQRIKLVKQLTLPPTAYMMNKYKTSSRVVLPFLYGYRMISGFFKRIKW